MQITAELLDKDIAGLESQIKSLAQQLEEGKAALASSVGALNTIRAMRNYLELPEPPPKMEISPENKAIQENDEARALSMQEAAGLVPPVPMEKVWPDVQDAELESLNADH